MKKLAILVTVYELSHLEMNKWLFFANKYESSEEFALIFATNNPNIDKNWVASIKKYSQFIQVEDNVKKIRTVIQAAKLIDAKWLKVVDPDDFVYFEKAEKLIAALETIDYKTPLVEVGYYSYYEDGFSEIGNFNRGFNHHAPNYSNIYNLEMLKGVEEPKNSFTVWDDYCLAIAVSKDISIKKAPVIPVIFTDYFNNIGETNTQNYSIENYKKYRILYKECLFAYEYATSVMDKIGKNFHGRNKLSLSQIKYLNRLIIMSNYNFIFRLSAAVAFSKKMSHFYTNIDNIKIAKLTFIFYTMIGRKM